jgi:PAS domain S-box-containing protein/putative nucleotidyltransferase with HDIG domain
MQDFALTKLQRILLTVALIAAVILLIGLISFRTQLFPASMLGTPTHVHMGFPDSNKRVLRVGGDNAYPPFSYLEDGEAKGFDNDLMRAVAEVMGVEVEFHLSPWDEAKQNLLDGKVDVIGGMAYSTDREMIYDFSTPHTELFFDLFVRRNSEIVDLRDIVGKQILIQSGGIMEDYLEQVDFSGTVIRVETPLEALKLLASGKYDGALLNKMQGYYFITEYHLSNLRSVGEYIEQRSYGFAIAEKNTTLLRELNQALATVNATGAYAQLNEKWFSAYKRDSFFDQARYYIYVGAGLVAFSLIAVAWLWAVRRTVRRRTEELKTSEEKYRRLIQNAAEGVIVISDGQIVYINPIGCDLLGIPAVDHIPQQTLAEIIYPDDLVPARHDYAEAIRQGADSVRVNVRVRRRNELRWMKVSLVRMDWETKPSVLCFFTDITDERIAEDKIRASEERYRLLFAKSPVGLFYYDNTLKITNTNEMMVQIMRSSHAKLEGLDLNAIKDHRILPALQAVLEHEEGFYEGPFTPIGEIANHDIYIKLHTTPLFNEKFEYKGGIAQIEDISDQIKNERTIKTLEERFSKAFFTSPDAININRMSDGQYLDCNRRFVELTGYSRDETLTTTSLNMNIWANPEDRQRLVNELREKGEVRNLEADFRMKDGKIISALMSASLIDVNDEKCILSITRDISEIKKAQLAIQESEERYRTIFNTVPVSLWEQDFLTLYDMLEELRESGVSDIAGYMEANPGFVDRAVKTVIVRDMNDESLAIFNAKTKEELFASIDVMFREESYLSFRGEIQAIWDKRPYYEGETINQTLDGQPIYVNVIFNIPREREDFAHILVSITDITARKTAEEQIKTQLQHMAALRAVDMAISASMDLQIVLRVLLNQVQQQLKVHSTSILLINPATQRLFFAAGAGFKSLAVERTDLRLGESYAGKAALERRIVAADDLSTRFSLLATNGMEEDGFTDYLGIPLISKGSVKGVLEIFNRGKLPQDPRWLSLLDSMASQAAIAIDNATLFDEAKKANIRLREAYDATIEGWARALELRDGDTEGHSERVADLAVQLAHAAGVEDSQLVALRRGALLHDIGKMGIPDTILLKPSSLTEEEWVIMRKHPTLGKEMLETIEFLKESLDIPYCHHERWDGKGYPRGLKGEEIPLMARVFSIIDGWDALRSDRPYRKAMTDDEAWKIIIENSGKGYDPEVVKEFGRLINRL